MIRTQDLSVQYGERVLFEDVSLKFIQGNCYGLIGPNGAGKSTFLKVLSGEVEPHSGSVVVTPGLRMAVLRQDHFAFNEVDALTTVLMGHERLYAIMQEKDALYAKPDFDEADGMRTAELEAEFGSIDGWEAEAQAGEQFSDDRDEGFIRQFLGRMLFTGDESRKPVTVLSGGERVRCMIARLMLESPQRLILDGPTNHLDLESIGALNDALSRRIGTLIFGSHDVELIESLTDRVIEITDDAVVDHQYGYTELLRRRTDEAAMAVVA